MLETEKTWKLKKINEQKIAKISLQKQPNKTKNQLNMTTEKEELTSFFKIDKAGII